MTGDEKLDMLLRIVQRIADEVGEIRTRLDRREGENSYRAQSGGEEPDGQPDDTTKWWETWTPWKRE